MKVVISFNKIMRPILLASFVLAGPLFSFQNGGSSIRGFVVGFDRTPLKRVTVQVQRLENGIIRSAKTDGDGQYRLSGLAPGRYKVELSSPWYYTETIQDVSVAPGETRSIPGFQLRFAGASDCSTEIHPSYYNLLREGSDTGALSGIVQDGQGGTVWHAEVKLVTAGKPPILAQTDSLGGFYLAHVAAGRDYRLLIEREGFFSEELTNLVVQEGLSAIYSPITLEACPPGRCQSYWKEVRVNPECG